MLEQALTDSNWLLVSVACGGVRAAAEKRGDVNLREFVDRVFGAP